MADRDLLHHAATCYRRAGHLDDAARCYRDAAMHREAAAVWQSLGALAEAAADLADAGRPEQAAWLLVHHLAAADQARALVATPPTPPTPDTPSGPAREPAHEPAAARRADLLRRLVLAHCDVTDADGTASPSALAILDAVMDELPQPAPTALDHDIEDWAVALAETIHRPDLVALLFAAAVRGGWHGAAQRWNAWSLQHLGVALVLPPTTEAADR